MEIVDQALSFLEKGLRDAAKPCVLYSGGKESQICLYLARQVRPDVSAVYMTVTDDARKHAFVRSVCAMWDVPLDERKPSARDLAGRGNHIEVINLFHIGPNAILHLGMQPVTENNQHHFCAVRERYKPIEDAPWPYDVAVCGQRDDDKDTLYGDVPVGADELRLGPVRAIFPLRRWTEADVWAATREYKIPQNYLRYDRRTGEKLSGSAFNNDYYHLCTRCLEPGLDAPDGVIDCPKFGSALYLGDLIDLEGRRKFYESVLINIGDKNVIPGVR